MKAKIILCDLDGTLLRSDKTISEKSADVLQKCQENGILVGFSTSRGRANIGAFEQKIKPEILICNGGASVFFRGEQIFCAEFSIEETRSILAKAYDVCGENAEITLDLIDKLFWNRECNKSTDYDKNAIFDDFKNFQHPAMKICVQTDDKSQAERIAAAVCDCDFLPFSDIPWYKFSPKCATKENAIRFLCDYLKIPCEQIIAFGDDHNDIRMLKICGVGVAMQNAIDEVKAVSDAVTKSNDEDGLADFLEQYLLCQKSL